MSPEVPATSDKHVPEHQWTAQMVGKHFILHHDIPHEDYTSEDLERVEFEISDTF